MYNTELRDEINKQINELIANAMKFGDIKMRYGADIFELVKANPLISKRISQCTSISWQNIQNFECSEK